MTERQLQFRVGLFVIVATIVAGIIVFQFGEFKNLWEPRYTLAIHFETAPGVYPHTPVRQAGIGIGAVSEIVLDKERGGVLVMVDVREQFRIRKDARPVINVSLLGDATVDFTAGKSPEFFEAGDRLKGQPPADPFTIVNRLDAKMSSTLKAFEETSREWQQVGHNMNRLLDADQGHLNEVVQRTAVALEDFSKTMKKTDQLLTETTRIVADPRNQQNLQKTLEILPQMVAQTQQTVTAIQSTVMQAEGTLRNLNEFTSPLAQRSNSIAARLDGTLKNLESLSGELEQLAKMVTSEDGTINKLATDPELYSNLNRSTASLAVLLKNLEPVVHDLRIFSDKVARHPELIGVSGAMRGSSGLKDPPPEDLPPRPSTAAGNVRLEQQ